MNMSDMSHMSACGCDILLVCGRDLRALACASSACEKVEPCHAGLKSLDQNPKSMGESELIRILEDLKVYIFNN
jgi:hypothetical protein